MDEGESSGLNSKIASFNAQANQHVQKQAINPFSNDNVKNMEKKQFSKDEYGRPVKGSLSEGRGFKASAQVCKEMLELCEIIEDYGEPCIVEEGTLNIPGKVIGFGDLFSIYTTISNKLVGILLRARKHKFIDFEGEVLFQRRDDHVPVVLMKPIKEIRDELHQNINSALGIKDDENRRSNEELADDSSQK